LQEAKKLDSATETKTVAGDTTPTSNNGLIIEFAWYMKKKGLADTTIRNRTKLLNLLVQKGANLIDTNSVETILATEISKIPLKRELVAVYFAFCKYRKIAWEKVKVNYEPKQVYTPTEEEINLLIGACGKRLMTFLMTLWDTGARKGEALKIRYSDVNSNTNEISINFPEKNGKSRKVKVSERTIAMINALPKKYGENLFSTHPHAFDSTFSYTRKALADKLQNPNIAKIHFHTFRYLRARKEYRKHKDVYEAKLLLGHKSILSTQRYTEGVEFQGDEYDSFEARTKEEARKLIEDGCNYVMDIDGVKLFSKPK
jgi:integrase